MTSSSLESLQRRVHLAHVQRPDLARSRLELLAELEPVLRALAQQREQSVPHAHRLMSCRMKLRIILSILRRRKRRRKPPEPPSARWPWARHEVALARRP